MKEARMDDLLRLIIALSILAILFFAYTTRNKLARVVVYTILAAIALSMALNGLAGIIGNVDFLSFLVDIIRFLNDLVVFVEIGVILFLVFLSKLSTKNTLLKATILVYVIVTLIMEFNVL